MNKRTLKIPQIEHYNFCELLNRLSRVRTCNTKKKKKKHSFTFIDLFAGIGGFHIGCENNGGKCVFACEINNAARKTYIANHHIDQKIFAKDITKIDVSTIPEHDLLCAGFPCQPFSTVGLKKGFDDARGTFFFYIAAIIQEKRPKAFFLENVRYLLNHDNGKTFNTIKFILEKQLGYHFFYKIVFATDFNLPQKRPRIFMVGFKEKVDAFQFPQGEPLTNNMAKIFNGKTCNREIGLTLRVGGRGSKFEDEHNWDKYIIDGKMVRMSPKEGLKMMGFPSDFIFPVSENQAMCQLGNSVALPAVEKTIQNIIKTMKSNKML